MNSSNTIFVLYKVSNSKCDSAHSPYNAFTIPRNPSNGGGVSLAEVKRQCVAVQCLNYAGADGYHWRVRVDDKPRQQPGSSCSKPSFTWWDVKDENSKLPVKESVPLSELEALFSPSSHNSHSSGTTSSSSSGGVGRGAVVGAVRGLGKAFQNVASTVEDVVLSSPVDPNEPRVSVIAFKLLDLIKVNNDLNGTRSNDIASAPSFVARRPRITPTPPPSNAAPLPTAQRPARPVATQSQPAPSASRAATARVTRSNVIPPPRSTSQTRAPARQGSTGATSVASTSESSELLMDFGPTPPPSTSTRIPAAKSFTQQPSHILHHSTSTPAIFMHETPEEILQREYAEKAKQQNRVWDEVDQRWVVVENGATNVSGSVAAPPGQSSTPPSDEKNNIKGISLDASNAIGKSVHVQAAVNHRVNQMKVAQEKAKEELKQREEQKKLAENEEDEVRKRLEPKVKAWSEEHGKKKQLAALLSSLHIILWPEAEWKAVSLGDLLEDKKLRRCYLRASLKVHPDKTRDLDAEKRFLAKRIFDALSQAMTVYEDSKR